MRVLIDECAPKALKILLSHQGHECRTVQEAGWSGKQNGELLRLAETAYDVFVTLDTSLEYQQNLTGRKISVVILLARTNRLIDLSPLFEECVAAIKKIVAGDVVRVGKST